MPGSTTIWLRGATVLIAAVLFAPRAATARVVEFSGNAQYGQWVRRQIAPGLWFCLTPIADTGRNNGWSIRIQPSCDRAAPDFAGVATPPYHGPNPIFIVAWFFDPGANAPHEVHDFRFVLHEPACRILAQAVETDSERLSAIRDQLARGRGHLVVNARRIDPHDGSLRWIRFTVRLEWPGDLPPSR